MSNPKMTIAVPSYHVKEYALRQLVFKHFGQHDDDIPTNVRGFVQDLDQVFQELSHHNKKMFEIFGGTAHRISDHELEAAYANDLMAHTITTPEFHAKERKASSQGTPESAHPGSVQGPTSLLQVSLPLEGGTPSKLPADAAYLRKLEVLKDSGVITPKDFDECMRRRSLSGSSGTPIIVSGASAKKEAPRQFNEPLRSPEPSKEVPVGVTKKALERFTKMEPTVKTSEKRLSTDGLKISVQDTKALFSGAGAGASGAATDRPRANSGSMGSVGIAARIKQYVNTGGEPTMVDHMDSPGRAPALGGQEVEFVEQEEDSSQSPRSMSAAAHQRILRSKSRPVTILPGTQTFDMRELQNESEYLAEGIDMSRREEYLADDQFYQTFHMSRSEFAALPKWKRDKQKQAADIF